MLFQWLSIFSEVPRGKPIFEIIEIHNFMMRRTQARSMVSFLITKFMKSDVRRTQARDHFFAFSLFSHWTSAKSRNRHSHALRRSLFFLAAVRVPVHILGFCNTSQLRIVFSEVKTWKVLTPFAFFTSGFKFVIIIFTSSNLNENHCRILTVFSRSRFSRLRRAKPTWEQHCFCSFKILSPSELQFSLKDSHQTAKVTSPR